MSKVRLFLLTPETELKYSFLGNLLTSNNKFEGGLFQQIEVEPFRSLVDFVAEPSEANYIFSPVNFSVLQKHPKEKDRLFACANEHDKPVLVFNYGDSNEPIVVPRGIVLRPTGYKSELLANERTIPAFVEDLGKAFGIETRKKENEKPLIGFSGMIRNPSFLSELKYRIRLLRTWIFITFVGASKASYQGLHYRRKAVQSLEASAEVDTLFHIRKTFSANIKTVEKAPEELRVEFIDSIKNSDLALVVRGDGNYSLRLFEVLSLGRIPLFIDTDSSLPLEDEIDYDSFMLRVDHLQIHRLPEIVSQWWQNITPEEYEAMQRRAREVFETRLRADVFYKHFFAKLVNASGH